MMTKTSSKITMKKTSKHGTRLLDKKNKQNQNAPKKGQARPPVEASQETVTRVERKEPVEIRYRFRHPRDARQRKIDVLKYALQQVKRTPEMEVYVGSDSQNYQTRTIYCTVVAFRIPGCGADYVFLTESLPPVRDFWQRLWREVEMSMEVAQLLSANNVDCEIEMDYNEDKRYKSNVLVPAAKGWATSLGYNVRCKPNCKLATFVADIHCR